MPIQGKSPSEVMKEYHEKFNELTIHGGFVNGLNDEINHTAQAEWLAEALASVIAWAAEEAKPNRADELLRGWSQPRDFVNDPSPEENNARSLRALAFNDGVGKYHDALIALAEGLAPVNVYHGGYHDPLILK